MLICDRKLKPSLRLNFTQGWHPWANLRVLVSFAWANFNICCVDFCKFFICSMLSFASSSFFPCWLLRVLDFCHVDFYKFFIFSMLVFATSWFLACWCLQTLYFFHYQISTLKVRYIPKAFFGSLIYHFCSWPISYLWKNVMNHWTTKQHFMAIWPCGLKVAHVGSSWPHVGSNWLHVGSIS